MENKEEKCPHCGGNRYVIAAQQGYADVTPVGKVFTMKTQNLFHIICQDCGTVIRSYVENPKKLIIKK